MTEAATTLFVREESVRDGVMLNQPDANLIANGSGRRQSPPPGRTVAAQRLIWEHKRFIFQSMVTGLLLSTAMAFLIPKRFQSTARLMPPDQANSSLAMLAAGSGAGASLGSSGLGAIAGDILGLKNTSDLFIGVLESRTVQDDVINKFNLKKLYWDQRMEDARDDLGKHTEVFADRKSGIITVLVTDTSPERAAAITAEYVNELNQVVTQLNTSSAHRERVFLGDSPGPGTKRPGIRRGAF